MCSTYADCTNNYDDAADDDHDNHNSPVALGIDFGTDSVRCGLFERDGSLVGDICSSSYASGTITRRRRAALDLDSVAKDDNVFSFRGLDLTQLPPHTCLQDADDWIHALQTATRQLRVENRIDPARVQSIGVSFTASTILPCDSAGTPLYQTTQFSGRNEPHAWWVLFLFCVAIFAGFCVVVWFFVAVLRRTHMIMHGTYIYVKSTDYYLCTWHHFFFAVFGTALASTAFRCAGSEGCFAFR